MVLGNIFIHLFYFFPLFCWNCLVKFFLPLRLDKVLTVCLLVHVSYCEEAKVIALYSLNQAIFFHDFLAMIGQIKRLLWTSDHLIKTPLGTLKKLLRACIPTNSFFVKQKSHIDSSQSQKFSRGSPRLFFFLFLLAYTWLFKVKYE